MHFQTTPPRFRAALLSVVALAAATTATAQCPDLIISQLDATFTGSRVNYTYTIQNIGTAPATFDRLIFQAYGSMDEIYNNGNDVPMGGRILSATAVTLQPGGTLFQTFGATPQAAWGIHTHPFLVAKVDNSNTFVECDENNNTAAARIPGSYAQSPGGCMGSNGVPTLAACAGAPPLFPGQIFCAEVSNLPTTGDPVFMLVGVVPIAPVPLDLIGMPGCTLDVDVIVTELLTNTGTTAQWTIGLVNDPMIIGSVFFSQCFVFDSSLTTPTGATTSNLADGVVG